MAPPAKRIGVLLVHGMGEQYEGQHAESVVRSLLKSWEGMANIHDVLARPPDRCGCEETCRPNQAHRHDGSTPTPCTCPDSAPFVLRATAGGEALEVHCHEVWWADLGQRTGLRHWARFWLWAARTPFMPPGKTPLGKAELARRETWDIVDPTSHRSGPSSVAQRVFLLGLVAFAGCVTLTWGLLRRAFRRLAPSRVLLLQTFGDVAMYQEPGRVDTGTGVDIGLPPRYAIRRRMVQEMVAMAERDYERWYVLAHSLGSIVAFNGLMEPEYILPNYLSETHWRRLVGTLRSEVEIDNTDAMRPRRPSWLGNRDGVCRRQLFSGLRGLVTYGSPLQLFADLWPKTVSVNLRAAFADGFAWINLHSPLDPFSGSLRTYRKIAEKQTTLPFVLSSHVYTGSWRAFIAHSRYLRPKRHRRDAARALGRWMLLEKSFQVEEIGKIGNRLLLAAQCLVVFVLVAAAIAVELAVAYFLLSVGVFQPLGNLLDRLLS